MINHKAIRKIMGDLLLRVEALLMLVCAAVSFYYHESAANGFLISAGITGGVGLLLELLSRGKVDAISRRDGYIMVTLSWVAFALFGALPFYFSDYGFSITNAFFESMSGISSTGATIMDHIDGAPRGLLFWRSLTQWFGGLGIIMFTIAILPFFGVNGLQMFAAEMSGPTHNKVNPRIGKTARWIWSVYIGLTVILTALLLLGGMSVFDSVCHAMSTAGTGGFSTHQDSIAYYHSPYIEYVVTVFMAISGINFSLLILMITGKFKKAIHDSELRWYIGFVAFISAVVTVVLYNASDLSAESAFRQALFQVVSLQTSTGLATADYTTWPVALHGLLLVVMLTGACAGSTSGGLKCVRVQVLFKVVRNEFKHILHPNAVLPVKLNKQVIHPSLIATIMAFCFLYFVIVAGSTIALSAMGVSLDESLSCCISSIGNMGPALGSYGPSNTWNSLPDAGKWLTALLMLLGRLEIFTIILIFTPEFWKRS